MTRTMMTVAPPPYGAVSVAIRLMVVGVLAGSILACADDGEPQGLSGQDAAAAVDTVVAVVEPPISISGDRASVPTPMAATSPLPTETPAAQSTPEQTATIEPTSEATPAAVPTAPAPTPVSTPPPTSAVTMPVSIPGFELPSFTITAGTAVVWTNEHGALHTVTHTEGAFDSGPLQRSDTFEHTFTTVGVIAYLCTVHPSMTGTITVE